MNEKLRTKLGLKLPILLNWIIIILSQNIFFLFFVFFFESITNDTARNWIIFAVLLFNFILPSSMARQNSNRISNNPLIDTLWQSQYNQNQLLNVTLLAEVIMFWAHEFMLQAMGLYVIIKISPNFIICAFSIISWILLISSIYFSKLRKTVLQSWGSEVRIVQNTEIFYLLRVILISLGIWLISKTLFLPLIKEPVPSNTYNQGIFKTFSTFSKHLELVFINHFQGLLKIVHYDWMYYIFGAVIFCYLVMTAFYLIYYSNKMNFTEKRTTLTLEKSTSYIFKFYQWIGKLVYSKNPWIRRDLIILERLTIHTKISQKTFLLIPPAFCSIMGLSIFFIENIDNYTNFILGFWFVCWIAISQTIWLWLWNYPILHPSSELRQIDLVKLTPYFSDTQYMECKRKLLMLLLWPLQIIISVIFVIGFIIMNGSILELCVGIIGTWLLSFMSCILSTYWLQLCSRFDYENIFMIRLDTYETKVLQYFFTIPKRIINGLLFIVFFIGVFLDHSLGKMFFYDIFMMLIIVWGFSWFFSKKKRKR
ncbi:hypothetical protein ABFE25_30200 [Bacillus toyonensis]|uniref:hypothetical protein n=1 Tax=Bacillus toyonensis TaxID=155322 RepID=UPI00321AE021